MSGVKHHLLAPVYIPLFMVQQTLREGLPYEETPGTEIDYSRKSLDSSNVQSLNPCYTKVIYRRKCHVITRLANLVGRDIAGKPGCGARCIIDHLALSSDARTETNLWLPQLSPPPLLGSGSLPAYAT